MGKISDWLDNFLMGGDENKSVNFESIEEKIPVEKHLEERKLQIAEIRKKREEKEEAENGLKFVIDGAKIKCNLCTVPDGDLKVNYDTPTIQDKRVATVVEKDMTSLLFKGNCKKSPLSASPCVSVMKLGDWKDVGTVYFQNEFPLLLKSTIKCEYGGVDITITDCAQRNEITNLDTIGVPVPSFISDFEIKLELDKNERTVVPFGILDFKNNIENPYFSFKYTLSRGSIDSLSFQVMNENDEIIYQMTHLQSVIIKASKKPEILFEAKKPTEGPLITKTWDYQEIYKQHVLFEPTDYTQIGEYYIHWDGFDNEEIYDSTRFNNKILKAKITAVKGDIVKSIVVDFYTKYSQVNWADVKIDKKIKRIDVTLRVNLTDGGAKGLDCNTYTTPEETSYETFTPTTGNEPYRGIEMMVCDWDKIPASVIKSSNPIIKSRTKSFQELEKLALEGIEKHWSRNNSFNVNINNKNFNLILKAINSKENCMNELSLIFNSNSAWGRSRNPGFLGKIFYNIGYCNYIDWYEPSFINSWGYLDFNKHKIDEDFKYTSAHELGHTVLKEYGGKWYSFTHDNSSSIFQRSNNKQSYILQKNKNEINLMHYFKDDPYQSKYDYNLIVASEKDVLSMIWLTKINIT